MAGTRSIEGIPVEQGVLDGLIARLGELETELAATRHRLAALEAQHTQTVVRVTAHEGRRPRFGWVALSVAVAAMAGALLGRPVPVEAAPSLAAALCKDVRLLKVAVNTLAMRDRWTMIKAGVPESPPYWRPFTAVGRDRRDGVIWLERRKQVLQSYTDDPGLKPDPLYDSDLCEECEGILPDF